MVSAYARSARQSWQMRARLTPKSCSITIVGPLSAFDVCAARSPGPANLTHDAAPVCGELLIFPESAIRHTPGRLLATLLDVHPDIVHLPHERTERELRAHPFRRFEAH